MEKVYLFATYKTAPPHGQKGTRMRSLLLLATFCSTINATTLYEWKQVVGPMQISHRSIVLPNNPCPKVPIGTSHVQSTERASPSSAFPVKVCEVEYEADFSNVDHAAVIGDTGCMVRGGDEKICDRSAHWPFRQISQKLDTTPPPLVIHLGDYVYRMRVQDESGQVYGDTWKLWRREFFEPSHSILGKSWFIFMRGNHEDCTHAERGWNRFFAPYPFANTCREFTKTYAVDIKNLRLIIVDSAAAGYGNMTLPASQQNSLSRELNRAKLLGSQRPGAWLFAHHPIVADWYSEENKAVCYSNLLRPIVSEATSIPVAVAGHLHAAAKMQLRKPRDFVQILSGHGGASLYENNASLVQKMKPCGHDYAKFSWTTKHGYSELVTKSSPQLTFIFIKSV